MAVKKTLEYQGDSKDSIEDAVNDALAKAKNTAYTHYEILETFGTQQQENQTHYQATVKVYMEH